MRQLTCRCGWSGDEGQARSTNYGYDCPKCGTQLATHGAVSIPETADESEAAPSVRRVLQEPADTKRRSRRNRKPPTTDAA